MPVPQTKDQLIAEVQSEYQALEELIATLTPEQMTQPGVIGKWSVKDVLAHLAEWEQMMLSWYAAGLRGENPQTPSDEFGWGQLHGLNQKIYEKHHQRELEEVLALFRAYYQEALALVQSLTEAELFSRGKYAWMGQHHLGNFIHANMGGHYRWAWKGIKKGLRLAVK
jgi:uncharacterized protein (TIGR03083 family)